MPRGVKPGQRLCRYDYDVWVEQDGTLYVKATAREYERASVESFYLAARRKVQRWLLDHGYPAELVYNQLETWDTARDWATMLPEAITYRTREPILADALDAAVA